MNEYLRSLIGELLETSDFLASLEELKAEKGKSRLFGDRVRSLTGDEIDRIRAGGKGFALQVIKGGVHFVSLGLLNLMHEFFSDGEIYYILLI